MTDLLVWAARWRIPPQALAELTALSVPHDTIDAEYAVPGDVSGAEASVISAAERDAIRRIRLDASRDGVTLLRNNSGAFKDATGRLIRFGLGNESAAFNRINKSSDLIGLLPGGRFLAIEAKREGWKWRGTRREEAQANFGRMITLRGGLFCFASSWAGARRILGI